ncbi:unnamed protein product [Cylicocyclus nassatus]|uniref:Uncharacterized protein n=1 Tax=Cylicocyclus nassatus TaxID=53992 RepID=A0AA36GZL3_CYLNA|nr:unnamed protein product [Cylicocyclus nassatus]
MKKSVATFSNTGRLISWDCLDNIRFCDPWEAKYIGNMRAVAIFMCLALVAEVVCLIWNFITFCACFCKRYIIHPLILMSFITAAFLAVAVIIYAATFRGHIGTVEIHRDEYGYSFWIAVAALVLAAIDIVVAAMSVFLGERGL